MGRRRGWYIAGAVVAAAALITAAAGREQLQAGNQPLQQLLNGGQPFQRFAAESQPVRQETTRVATAVRTAPVQRGAVAQTLSYTGDVRAKNQVSVVPKMAGRIEKLMVDVGDRVEPGQPIASLEREVVDAQVEQARAGVALARARLAGLEDGPRVETVGQADANLRLAEAKLAALKAGPAKAQVDAAEASVRAAKNQLYAVQANADSLLSRRGTGYTEDMKEAQSGAAYEQIKQAEAQLAALTAPPTKEQLDQAEAAVEAARQQLALAQSPYTDNDLAAARATVAQAEASLKLATVQQKNANVEAPISGVVSERFVTKGDMASPAAPMLLILGEGTEIQIGVEEAMVSQVSTGKPVTVTVTAYPGLPLAGKVTYLSPSLDPRTRASLVKIEVEDSNSLLKPGMFAQATIVTASREGALLVPRRAVVERNQRQVVFIAADGAAAMKEVRTGLSDGKVVEILSGLKEGDRAILGGQSDLADGDPVQVEGSAQ